jgi:hypothetical protein
MPKFSSFKVGNRLEMLPDLQRYSRFEAYLWMFFFLLLYLNATFVFLQFVTSVITISDGLTKILTERNCKQNNVNICGFTNACGVKVVSAWIHLTGVFTSIASNTLLFQMQF